MTWPPGLDELKSDLSITDNRDDVALGQTLAAAVVFVERVRPEFNYPGRPEVGDVVPLAVNITDADGVLVNATTITLEVELPDGTLVPITVVNPPPDTGRYGEDYLSVQVGHHVARWASTGPNAVHAEPFDVRALSGFPVPTADLELGTLRLAGRWHTRRRSPDGLVEMGEMGVSRIPTFDPDIERLLGLGRYRGPVFA